MTTAEKTPRFRQTVAGRLAPARLKRRRQSVPVLIVLSGDGAVEVYGENIRVHFVHRLDVQGLEAERLADEYLDLTLPKSCKQLYFPLNMAGVDICRRRTVQDEADMRMEVEILRELRGLVDENRRANA